MAKPKHERTHHSKSSSSAIPGNPEAWKWKVLGFIAFLVLLSLLWTTGLFQKWTLGPKIPLPRQVAGLSLGMNMQEVLQKYPSVKKLLRPYNNDPLFNIATLPSPSGPTGPSTLDLLFFKDQLYYVSAMWEGGNIGSVPLDEWSKQFRRWNRNKGSSIETLGSQATLKEWNFTEDGETEMVLRDLSYSDQVKRWEDLRDASNEAAQAAFSKYRLETGG